MEVTLPLTYFIVANFTCYIIGIIVGYFMDKE